VCLSAITEQYERPSLLILDAWKTFAGSASRPCFESYPYRGESYVPLDQWIEAEGTKDVVSSDGKKYKAGFHVFEEAKDEPKPYAPRRRVYVRRVRTKGKQDKDTVLVADEMYVPSDPEAWPPMSGEKGPEGKAPGVMDRIKKIAGKGGNA
jgi:hypothetical protein